MVLSRTRRGSLPSALTRLSLPKAIPFGQRFLAALRPPGTCFIQPAASSSARRDATVSGSSSAGRQLPWQTSRPDWDRGWSLAGGQRPEGFISEKTPVWTPSASMPGRSESGSSMRWASARINSNLKGWPGLTVSIKAWSRFRAEQRIASASDCSSCDRGCSGLLWLMCAKTLCERLDFCAQAGLGGLADA